VLEHFKKHIDDDLPFLNGSRLLLAVSGGLDSIVMCELCDKLELDMALAHCNFNLRGAESDKDERLVMQLGEEKEIEVFIQHFETERYAKEQRLSTQMAARELRYAWFNELADQLNFDYILTAHRADDDLETFLINLSRGTGFDGFNGIPELNEKIVRPLLNYSREDILNYAKAEKLIWREDGSNTSLKYLRNKIRHEVIPKLKETSPTFLENFKRTQQHLRDVTVIVNDRIDVVFENSCDVSAEGIRFDIEKLKKLDQPKAYLYQLLKGYGFTDWHGVYDLIDAQSGKQIFSDNFCLLRDRNTLILTERSNLVSEEFFINEFQTKVETEIGILKISKFDELSKKSTNIEDLAHYAKCIYVDKDRLTFPLSIKKWEKGNFFYPLGMNGKKKVSKFFKDEKLSMIEKDQVRLLYSEDDIVWIIGMRADDRFKVTKDTDHILKIELL
jgi:tRNA(Ile)-lysidine synthase